MTIFFIIKNKYLVWKNQVTYMKVPSLNQVTYMGKKSSDQVTYMRLVWIK